MVETNENQEQVHPQKASSKKMLWLIGVSVLLIVIASGIWLLNRNNDNGSLQSSSSSKGAKGPYIIYSKDDKVQVKQAGSDEKGTVLSSNNYLSYLTQAAGKLIVFPDQIDEYESEYTLRYVTTDKLEERKKIDNNVNTFTINEQGTHVIYTKYEKNELNLYLYNFDKAMKLDSDIEYFISSDPSGKQVVYSKDEALYQIELKGNYDPVKIDNDAVYIQSNEEFTKLYYTKDRELYLKEAGKSSVKLIDEFDYSVQINENGSMYYVVSEVLETPLMSFVEDDFAAVDLAVKEPNVDDYTSIETYTDWWNDTYESEVTDWWAYEEAYYQYEEKLERESLRDELKSNVITQVNEHLYYFDGKQSNMITDNYSWKVSISAPNVESPVIIYQKQLVSGMSKVLLSELYSIDTIYENSYDLVTQDSDHIYVALADQEYELDYDQISNLQVNPTGDSIYFNRYDDDSNNEIVKIPISNNKLQQEIKVIESQKESVSYDFYNNDVIHYNNIRTIYSSRGGTTFAELHIDGQYADDKVDPYYVDIDQEDQSILYMTRYSEYSQSGTLMQYRNKKSIKVADDVNEYVKHQSDEIAFITDYDINQRTGDLYYGSIGREALLIDDKVSYIYSIIK